MMMLNKFRSSFARFLNPAIKNNLYKYYRFISDYTKLIYNLSLYKFSRKKPISNDVEMLVVGSVDYVWVSIHCITSFLRFNPNSKIIVHVDQKTFRIAHFIYSIIDRKRITTSKIEFEKFPPLWTKANLILNLQGTSKIFMDADLRWNSELPNISTKNIVVFSNEFDMAKLKFYSYLFQEMQWSLESPINMYNTSFFCWSNNNLEIEFEFILNYLAKFDEIKNRRENKDSSHEHTFRLSEQISLSYLLRNSPVTALDKVLAMKNLSPVESTYYGATGHRFGR